LGIVFQLSHYFRIFAREMWSFLPSSFLGAEQFYAESMLQKALMYSF